MIETSQLLLNIKLTDDATFENYVGDPAIPQTLLQQLNQSDDHLWYLYLWGGKGVGCSHLLQAACHEGRDMGLTCVYLCLSEAETMSASILDGLEKLDLVCIDGVEAVTGNSGWEEALFHMFNRIRESGNNLLVAAKTPPVHIDFSLADLQSRLTSGLIYQVKPLTDEQKVQAIQLRARNRGMQVDRDLAKFIITRSSRDTSCLFHSLDKLDEASLHHKRRLTISFAKQVLGL
jgi:DnaA family protein